MDAPLVAQGARRGRPPTLALPNRRPVPNTIIVDSAPSPAPAPPHRASTRTKPRLGLTAPTAPRIESDVEIDSDSGSPTSSSYASPASDRPAATEDGSDGDAASDDLSKDLAMLEKLRRNVHKNLRLRPIRMASSPDLQQLSAAQSSASMASGGGGGPVSSASRSPSPNPLGYQKPPFNIASSPTSSVGSPSVYYTPFSDFASSPRSAHFLGYIQGTAPHPASPLPNAHFPQGVTAAFIFDRLNDGDSKRPLLIDTRQPGSYLASRVLYSFNIAIPTLILKRCRKPGGGFASIDALRQFVSTERGKAAWDEMMQPGGLWDGDVVVYDEEMHEKDKDSLSIPAWALLPVLKPLVSNGHVDYLRGGLSSARYLPQANHFLVSGEREFENKDRTFSSNDDDLPHNGPGTPRKGGGLFQLRTDAFPSKPMPQIEQPTPSRSPSPPRSASPPPPPSPPRSARRIPPPLKKVPPALNVHRVPRKPLTIDLDLDLDTVPSPPPSATQFPRSMKRPSAPNLRKLDTASKERLRLNLGNGHPPPKLSIRAPPTRAATLAVSTPSTSGLNRPNSPSHLTLVHSTHTPPGSARLGVNGFNMGASDYLPPPTPSLSPSFPTSPRTPRAYSPPRTARPDDTPTTEEPSQPFTVSTILPNFLFLGPELSTPEHVETLQAHGVKRILNIAIECDDDQGLNLRGVFEKYIRIPMRDTVEEENVPKCVRQVCEALDDARLHSSPTYVHCKAGKSRSVTAVMAYLIHANHWTLSRAYSFVLERRKGISPNIGFVSELMNFEELELGGKSHGVVSGSHGGGAGDSDDNADGGGDGGAADGKKNGNYMHAAGARRGGHMRESLPPILPHSHTETVHSGALSASGIGLGAFGGGMGIGSGRGATDGHEEMEIKDAQGRYRHARRAPVDEQTLQPSRRVSKAGLESSSYMALDPSADF